MSPLRRQTCSGENAWLLHAQNMLETMKLVCELLSADGDGSIPLELFYEIYEYLAKIDGTISAKTIQALRDYLDQFAYVNHTTDGSTCS